MTIPNLGTLQTVSVRDAWPHEAHSFTPWLAEHLEQLSELINVSLELEGREVSVDAFSADILARDIDDDSRVLIENQLERTDHKHLGQIMTYLAGLNAHKIIWIAAAFHDAHLAAIEWLNTHTVEPFAFFAVQVKVVKIGDSLPAPIFELISKPNSWTRQIQEQAAGDGSLTELGQFRLDFWTHFVNRHPSHAVHGKANARSYRTLTRESNDIKIVGYLADKSVGVFLRDGEAIDKDEAWRRLQPHAGVLDAELGTALREEGKRHLFITWEEHECRDRSNWNSMADWLAETLRRYDAALTNVGL